MMVIFSKLVSLLFPPKCILCNKLLAREETDLCHDCRCNTDEYKTKNVTLPHLAQWTALWYYEGNVRASIHRFKFSGKRSYADAYGRLLAMKLLREDVQFDILTWIPISKKRRRHRGYDQCMLLVQSLGNALGISAQPLLEKCRNNRPQSELTNAAARRANVLGIYRCIHSDLVRGKKVLLIDDVLTTGATAGECARVLLTAGAKEVICATIAAANHKQK